MIRPDVVLYEEALDPEKLERAAAYISDADMLINKSATPMDAKADLLIQDSIGRVLAGTV